MTYFARSKTVADGVQTVFAIGFPYQAKTDVSIYVYADGTTSLPAPKVSGLDYDWTSSAQITFRVGKVPAAGMIVEARRTSKISSLNKTVQAGGTFKAADIVSNDTQQLYLAQENLDASVDEAAEQTNLAEALTRLGAPAINKYPRKLTYANRPRCETDIEAVALSQTVQTALVGYGGPTGPGPVTGGYGKPLIYVKNPSLSRSPLDSLGRALDLVAANAGGTIYWDVEGYFRVDLSDWMELSGLNNFSWVVPGRNVEISFPRLQGAVHLGANNNVLWHGTRFKPLPGPILGSVVSLDVSTARTIITHRYDTGQGLAVMFNEFWKPAWHCLDITRATAPAGGDPACYVTIMGNIFWSAVQAHLLGTNNSQLSGGSYTSEASVRKLFCTLYGNAYLYVLQRLPKGLGNAMLDVAWNYFLLAPYDNENASVPPIKTDAFGVAVQEGAYARSRGNLFRSAHPSIDGPVGYAMHLVTGGYSGNTGYISDEGNVAENGLIKETRNPELIPALPYSLPVPVIPDPGPARAKWVADLLAFAGAAVDPAPEGLFVPEVVTSASRVPNGITVVLDDPTDRTVQMERVDALHEAGAATTNEQTLLSPLSLSYTRNIGWTAGKVTNPAIAANVLDLANIESPYFAVEGYAGGVVVAATLKHVVRTDGLSFEPGSRLWLQGVSGGPTTIVTASTNTVTATAATDVINSPSHGETGSGGVVQFSSTATLPAPLVANVPYYIIYVDANNHKVAATAADAIAGNAIDLTSAGSGTITATYGSFNLPGNLPIILNASAKIGGFILNPGNNRFSAIGPSFPLTGSVIWNPPNLANSAQQSTTMTVTGAAVGDAVVLGFSQSLGGTQLRGEVTAADTVTIYHTNLSGGAVDVAQGTVYAKVWPSIR